MSTTNTGVSSQERVLEIRLLPQKGSAGEFELRFFSENIPDDRGALLSALEEIILRGKDKQLFPTCNEHPVNDTEIVLEFTLTEGQERVDVWVDNFPLIPVAILQTLLGIHADLAGYAQD